MRPNRANPFEDIRYVFLDREGILNSKPPEGQYVANWEQSQILPGVEQAIARLNQAECTVIVVTNQRGVAQGLMAEGALIEVHDRLRKLLRAEGAEIDRIYSCIHEVGSCRCRKPDPGLLLEAMAEDPDIARSRFVMIGDSHSDVLAGRRAKAETVRLSDRHLPQAQTAGATYVAQTLSEAVDWVLNR